MIDLTRRQLLMLAAPVPAVLAVSQPRRTGPRNHGTHDFSERSNSLIKRLE
jgi:hypothetical protein